MFRGGSQSPDQVSGWHTLQWTLTRADKPGGGSADPGPESRTFQERECPPGGCAIGKPAEPSFCMGKVWRPPRQESPFPSAVGASGLRVVGGVARLECSVAIPSPCGSSLASL